MSRQCDAIGCTANVLTGKLMCLKHWHMVPLTTQRTIYDRYRALRRDYAFLSDVDYLTACVTAIDDIARVEGKQGRNPYAGRLQAARRRAEGG